MTATDLQTHLHVSANLTLNFNALLMMDDKMQPNYEVLTERTT